MSEEAGPPESEEATADGGATPDDTPVPGGPLRVPVEGGTLALPETATDGEAAAIVAAVGAHLTDLDRAAAAAAADDADDETGWDGHRWSFAGRTEAVGGRPARPTDSTPTDPWTAAGRSDRL